MKNRIQNGFVMHYDNGVCNIAPDTKSFYAKNIRSGFKVPCMFVEFREG